MITTTKEYTIKRLNAEIKYIFHTKISWERRHTSERQIIQCHRCQSWGHATTNCRMPPKCLKCAQPHLTYQCKKDPNTPAKCANCDQDHPANYTGCEVYTRKLETLHKTNTIKNYTSAPAPKVNAWSRTRPTLVTNASKVTSAHTRAGGVPLFAIQAPPPKATPPNSYRQCQSDARLPGISFGISNSQQSG